MNKDAPLNGKVRKLRYYKYPRFDNWKQTLVGTQHGEAVVSFKPRFPEAKGNWGVFRIDDNYFLVERTNAEIYIISLYKTEVIAERTINSEEATQRYPRWWFCSLPTIVRYFGTGGTSASH